MESVVDRWMNAIARAQIAGFVVGVAHAVVLGLFGLYAESGPLQVAASALRYGAFGLFGATAGGLALQAVVELRWWGSRIAPVGSVSIAAYLGVWALFLFKQSGQIGVGGIFPGAAVAVVAAIVLLFSLREMRVRPHPRSRIAAAIGFAIAAALLTLDPGASSPVMSETDDGTSLELARPAATAPFAPGGWNVLFLTFDTLRADHLGSYGYERAWTAALDSLAESGVQFENAIVQRPKTSPNVATFITGTYPARHGIHTPMRRLPDRAQTLAEILAEAGWRTGAVITNGNLYPEFAFDQGFEEFLYGHRDAKEGADKALDWLDRWGEQPEPWHLWVHTTDPHWPYEPPPEWVERFADPDHDRVETQVALYDGEIAWSSQQTGRILAWLSVHPDVRDRTLVVFTADHGESLGEHEYEFEHGLHPYEPSARVPLVFSMPGRVPEGERRVAVVGSVDLVPTILDIVDVAVPEAVQGNSVLPLVQGIEDQGPRDFVFFEAGYGEHIGRGRTRVLRTEHTKYVRRLKEWALRPSPGSVIWTFDAALEGALSPDEFYDLQEDPKELRPVSGEASDSRDRVDAFHRWLASQVGSTNADGSVELDPETEESLRSLGYIE